MALLVSHGNYYSHIKSKQTKKRGNKKLIFMKQKFPKSKKKKKQRMGKSSRQGN